MEETKDNIQRPYKGMFTDCSPSDQPKDTYRYALNAVTQAEENTNFLSTEQSNKIQQLLGDYILVGHITMQDNTVAVFGTSVDSGDLIGLFDGTLTTIVDNINLGFDAAYPISGVYRIRRAQRNIYWVEYNNKPRYFNFDRPFDFYTKAAKDYYVLYNNLNGYAGDLWDINTFNLLTSYQRVPEFVKTEVIEGGNIPSGSYSAAIQLVDENLNPTEWITESSPVRIYVDSLTSNYEEIRGSKNSQSPTYNFENANKSIVWTLGNFDPRFLYYRIAVLQANQGDGNIAKALVSPLNSVANLKFTYSGNDSDYTTTPLTDIALGPIDIENVSHIAQLENRLILTGIKGKQVDWCELQAFASKIRSSAELVKIPVNDIELDGDVKNPVSLIIPYMPDEVYSFGVVYEFEGGFESPAFHIPGRAQGDTEQAEAAIKAFTNMDFYQCPNNLYTPMHVCMTENFWGNDGDDNPLVNTPIRHHKFLPRTSALKEKGTVTVVTGHDVEAKLSLVFAPESFVGHGSYNLTVTYSVNGVVYTTELEMSAAGWRNLTSPYEFILGYHPLGSTIELIEFEDSVIGGEEGETFPGFSYNETTNYNHEVTETKEITYSEGYVIRFSNIIQPYENIVGYRIVRNKRTEDDKIVVDNAILGPLMNTQKEGGADNEYHAFGLLSPNTLAENISKRGFYIFSPEHQFGNKKLNFSSIELRGIYEQDSSYNSGNPFVPIEVFTEGTPENGTIYDANGAYVQDVQAGTSFNSAYNKGEDPDGFDLQVLYRNSKFIYSPLPIEVFKVLGNPDQKYYLSACGYKTTPDGLTFFNASSDNKIIIVGYDTDVVLTEGVLFSNDNFATLYSVVLKRENLTAYANFINRTYYSEHQNIIYFSEPIGDSNTSPQIANGDAYVTPMTINSSTYFDTKLATRAKKNKVWKIIAGAALIIGGLVAEILSFGAATPLTAMAISYGISLLTSGISFEVMKKMIDSHYEAGLKICLEDDDNKDENYKSAQIYLQQTFAPVADDRLCWFTDRIQDIYFESSINTALRNGVTAPISDFNNSLSTDLDYDNCGPYEAYLESKFTVVDRERNSGRLYTGIPCSEIYDINPDYLRKNYEKSYYCLPAEYECCSAAIETYPNRSYYSEQSYQEEKLDNYRKILPNNYKDIEGEFGRVTNIFRQGASLLIHTEEALFHLPQNLQERVNQELVSFIGTGEFFSIPPRKLNGFGSRHKFATTVSPMGTLYVSQHDKKVLLLLGEESKEISNNGMYYWFQENLKLFLTESMEDTTGLNLKLHDSTLSENGIGIHSCYDPVNRRFLVTKIDYKPLTYIVSEANTNVVNMYENNYLIPEDGTIVYDYVTGKFGAQRWTDIGQDDWQGSLEEITLQDAEYFEDKSWTISYSLVTQSWTSFHSYLPAYFISTMKALYSVSKRELDTIYLHSKDKVFLEYYGTRYPFIVELVSVSNPIVERIWNHITILSGAKKWVTNSVWNRVRDVFFTNLIAYNSRQSSGEQSILTKVEDENFMLNQIQDASDTVLTENREGKFSINDLRDYTAFELPLFTSDWNDPVYRSLYPIDKVPNPLVIKKDKDWMQLESFRDKYLVLRLIFSNFAEIDNVELVVNYSIENEQISIR